MNFTSNPPDEVIRTWFACNEILSEHKPLPVTQVYCWLLTQDKNVALVNSNGKWQFPGGHPNTGETIIETCIREVNEETGIQISSYREQLNFFGYYLIQSPNEQPSSYLQVRFFLNLPANSYDIKIHVNEQENEERKVLETGFFTLDQACELIPWLSKTEELKTFREKAA